MDLMRVRFPQWAYGFRNMTQEEFNYLQEKSLKYVLISLIHNTNIIPELSEEDREVVLNNVFNAMLNSLKPDAAIVWNELILSFSEKYQSEQNVNDIMQQLKEIKGEDGGSNS